MTDRERWTVHLKDLRLRHDVDLMEAERIALSDSTWCRWVTHQINNDRRCRKMALSHIKVRGDRALVYTDGDVLKVRGDLEARE